MFLNLDRLPKNFELPEATLLSLYPGQMFLNSSYLLRLHLFNPTEGLKIVYVPSNTVLPCSEAEGQPVTHEEFLTDIPLVESTHLQFQSRSYVIIRRTEATLEFFKEINPQHFRLGLYDETLENTLRLVG